MRQIRRTTHSTEIAEGATGGKELILREAHSRFTTTGYTDVTMQDIAEAVGLTKATIYYHFGDKEGLFAEVFVEEMARICDGIAACLVDGATLREQLERTARFLIETGRSQFSRLIAEFDRYVAPEQQTALIDRAPHPFVAIRPAFERAAAAGEIRPFDLDVAISLFFAMVFGQIRFAAYGRPAPATPEGLAWAIVEMTLRGIGA